MVPAPRTLLGLRRGPAANRWTTAFNGGAGRENLGRPLLKPLANGIWAHLPNAHVLVAGTELNKHYVEQALSSNVFKRRAGATQFSDFGGTVLQQGPQDVSISNVINNIVYAAAGEKIKDFPFMKLHMRIRSLVPDDFPPVSSFGKRVMVSDTRTIRIVRRGILSFLCHSEFPKYSAQKLDLIANGIGRFIVRDDDESIQISERLVLCSLMNYFNHPRNPVGLRVRINEQHSKLGTSEQAAGYGFEDASSYLFYNAFTPDDQPTPLLDVFAFQRSDDPNNKYDLTPEWAHCSAHLVRTWHTSTPERVQRNLTAVISTKAHNVPETLAWFMDENRAPFLKPDEHFGSDIIFVLRLCDPTGRFHGKLLFVSVTCKAWKNRHGGLKVKKPLFTSSPEGYFLGLTGESKARARMDILNVLHAFFPPLSGNKRPKEKEADDESEDESDPEEDAPPVALPLPRPPPVALPLPRPPPVALPLPRPRAPAKGKAKSRAKEAKASPKPKPKPKQGPKKYVYGDTVDFAVLRVVACYPHTFKLADPPTTSQGLYPLAMLSEKIMQLGCSFGFDAFEEAMERVGMKPDLDDEQILEEENAAFILPETIQLNRPEEEGIEDDDEGAKSDDSFEQFFEWSTVKIKKIVEADYPIEKVPLSSRANLSAAPTTTRKGDPSNDVARGEPSGVRYLGANAGMDVEGSNKDGEDLEAADDDSNFDDDGDSNFHDDGDSNFHEDDDDDGVRIYADARDGYNEDGDADNEREDGDEYELAGDYEEEEKARTYEGSPDSKDEEEGSAMDLDEDAVGASQPTVLDTAVAGLELDSDDAWGTQESEAEDENVAPRAQSVKRKASPGIDQDRVFRRRRDE
ncbi:hypothetical protein EXIGLDRAFT_762027 [Exidia glandulosa HHB12029]|uniref:Uncharacterized protein n=1 Tax=Exidia glandulosa HHB12029 TaxID=1314781 RepID=A0A165N3R4_EXIGL|nr:hypothetical protein EXIGLDRAFT_762027 [Exidia glandulosa HHB12029]